MPGIEYRSATNKAYILPAVFSRDNFLISFPPLPFHPFLHFIVLDVIAMIWGCGVYN